MNKTIKLGNTLIDVVTKKEVVSTDINRAFSDEGAKPQLLKHAHYDGGKRRYLDNLPVPAPQSKAIAIIAAYTLFGLSASDIAHVLNTDVTVVENVRDTEEFITFLECMLQNIREHDTDKVRKLINDNALTAAEKIVGLTKSHDEKVALSASKDILDRRASGDLSNNASNNKATGLTIRIIDDRNDPSIGLEVDIDA